MDQPRLTPQVAYNLASALAIERDERDPRLEAVIAQDPVTALKYARFVIGGRWPEAESIIMSDAGLAVGYAYYVLGGCWPEAEPTIAQYAGTAYDYAFFVRGPWPEAEPTIARDSWYAYRYKKDVLDTPEDHVRFEEIEQWAKGQN